MHRIEAYGPAGTAVVECVTRAVEGLGFGGGIASTACPPAVVAGMICRGELAAPRRRSRASGRCRSARSSSACARYGVEVREQVGAA